MGVYCISCHLKVGGPGASFEGPVLQLWRTGLVVTMIFLVLLLPVCLHYRSIELQQNADTETEGQEDVKIHRHRHERHRPRDRSPPPKYHESTLNKDISDQYK